MAITNYERIGKAMDLLRQGIAPYVEREFRSAYKDKSQDEARRLLNDDRMLACSGSVKLKTINRRGIAVDHFPERSVILPS